MKHLSVMGIYRVFFTLVPPLKSSKYKQVNLGRLGVSSPIYVNVDSPNLGFPYFNFLRGYQRKKHPVLLLINGRQCLITRAGHLTFTSAVIAHIFGQYQITFQKVTSPSRVCTETFENTKKA